MTDSPPSGHTPHHPDTPMRRPPVESRGDADGPPLALRIALVAMLVLFVGFAVGLAFSSHRSGGAAPQPESVVNN